LNQDIKNRVMMGLKRHTIMQTDGETGNI